MAQPVRQGQLVLWNSTYSVEQLPAVVVEIPLYVVGGGKNEDADGNPLIVNLLVFTMQGPLPKYHVNYADSDVRGTYFPSTWSEIPPQTA